MTSNEKIFKNTGKRFDLLNITWVWNRPGQDIEKKGAIENDSMSTVKEETVEERVF